MSELWLGLHNSRLVEKNRQALECLLGPVEKLPYGNKADRIYGRHRAALKNAGTPVGSMDMLIAAHALSEDAILVTH